MTSKLSTRPTLLFALLLVSAVRAYAVDLKVTDSTGVELLITGATIDYSGMIGSDKETEGVRVQVGEALITAKWTDIQSLTITGRDSASTQMIVEIALKNGRNVNARLVRKGKMTITGKADLGAYSLELEKVRKITPVR